MFILSRVARVRISARWAASPCWRRWAASCPATAPRSLWQIASWPESGPAMPCRRECPRLWLRWYVKLCLYVLEMPKIQRRFLLFIASPHFSCRFQRFPYYLLFIIFNHRFFFLILILTVGVRSDASDGHAWQSNYYRWTRQRYTNFCNGFNFILLFSFCVLAEWIWWASFSVLTQLSILY